MKKQKQTKKTTTKKFTKKDNLCNICQKPSDLSEDHVPPKNCLPAKDLIIKKLWYQMGIDNSFRPRLAQNGVTYRTICNSCNNLLGTKYDWILGDFAKKIETFVESTVILPTCFEVECQPNAIMRSILGHLLAAKTETDQVITDQLIRPCILDPSEPIHDDIHIYYWVYPYKEIVVFRDFSMPAVRGKFHEVAFFNMLKFYPIAFLITHQLLQYEGLDSLHKFNQFSPNDKATIPIRLRPVRKKTWPEKCENDNFIAVGRTISDSVHAVPKYK